MGFRIFTGLLLGVGFKFLQDLLAPMALVYGIPPLVAVILPTALCLWLAFISCVDSLNGHSIKRCQINQRRIGGRIRIELSNPLPQTQTANANSKQQTAKQQTATYNLNQKTPRFR